MLKTDIRIIGTEYCVEDMLVDTVERCHCLVITDDEGWWQIFSVGDNYRDGKIVDCFVHPESDCIFVVIECNGVYFEVTFDNWKRYRIEMEPLPFD